MKALSFPLPVLSKFDIQCDGGLRLAHGHFVRQRLLVKFGGFLRIVLFENQSLPFRGKRQIV